MELVIFTDKNMISKTDWINEKPSFRNGWNEICDILIIMMICQLFMRILGLN